MSMYYLGAPQAATKLQQLFDSAKYMNTDKTSIFRRIAWNIELDYRY